MRIRFPPISVEAMIAWEEQSGQREGFFISLPTGTVLYRHPAHQDEWIAGNTREEFREAAGIWNRYCDEVVGKSEAEQMAAVERLREGLDSLGLLTDMPATYWSVLYEQAEAGLL